MYAEHRRALTFVYVRFHLETSYQLVALKEAYHRFPSMTSKLNETYKLLASKISCNHLVRCFDIGAKKARVPGWTLKIKSAEFIWTGWDEVISLLDDKSDPMAEARGRLAVLCGMMLTNIPNSKQSSESSLKIVKHSRSLQDLYLDGTVTVASNSGGL